MEEMYSHPCKIFNVGFKTPWVDYAPKTLDETITLTSVEKNDGQQTDVAQSV